MRADIKRHGKTMVTDDWAYPACLETAMWNLSKHFRKKMNILRTPWVLKITWSFWRLEMWYALARLLDQCFMDKRASISALITVACPTFSFNSYPIHACAAGGSHSASNAWNPMRENMQKSCRKRYAAVVVKTLPWAECVWPLATCVTVG